MRAANAWVDYWAAHRPDHPAIVFEGRTVTYQGLAAAVYAAARSLVELGISPGDRIVWLGHNHPAFVTVLLAATRVGAVFTPLDPDLTTTAHRDRLNATMPKVAVVDNSCAEHLADVLTMTSSSPKVIHLGATAETSIGPGDDRISTTTSTTNEDGMADPASPAILFFTSGAGSKTKAVTHTHSSVLHTVLNGVAAHDLRSDDIGLAFEPLWRAPGLTIQVLPLLYVGGTIVLHRRFDPEAVLIGLETNAATVALFVPANMQAVVDHEDWLFTRFASLRGVMTTSATVSDELFDAFRERGIRTGQIYGATETGPAAAILRFADCERRNTVGKSALHTSVRLGSDREIQVRGPNVFAGYWNDPEATAAAFTEDGWFRTGNQGELVDGWLTITD